MFDRARELNAEKADLIGHEFRDYGIHSLPGSQIAHRWHSSRRTGRTSCPQHTQVGLMGDQSCSQPQQPEAQAPTLFSKQSEFVVWGPPPGRKERKKKRTHDLGPFFLSPAEKKRSKRGTNGAMHTRNTRINCEKNRSNIFHPTLSGRTHIEPGKNKRGSSICGIVLLVVGQCPLNKIYIQQLHRFAVYLPYWAARSPPFPHPKSCDMLDTFAIWIRKVGNELMEL